MLPPWVSHCELDDRMIFLDVRRNRYSALSAEAGRHLVRGEFEKLHPKIFRQIDRWGWQGALSERPDGGDRGMIRPVRELSAEMRGVSALRRHILAAVACVMATKYLLRTRKLETLLQGIVAANASCASFKDAATLGQLVAAFDVTERIVFGAKDCLIRSLALHRLLSSHGHVATLVFGVRLHPFKAHCWLQGDDLVLNDTVEQIGLFHPVRVVQ